ncbi:RICIN domain-containing protein [Streptomyces sp. S.PNR 29]|nr:RICIN domain-containing protein [Streptomyces sp. S.PNR 29]MDN0194570.1 RICIN domain-containing protein [Streptomyces sp. S.PNR 29]
MPSNTYNVAISANSTADGAAIIQWPTTGGSNQQWKLVRIACP